jgi:hypothetical protein
MDDDRATDGPTDEMTRAKAIEQWLGVPQPAPTHYELLRVPNLTDDRKALFEGARQAKRRLRAYQIGRYRELALDLLAEVGRAVSVLTNPEKKRAYDAQLLARWRQSLVRLFETHVQGRPPEPAVLEAWLAACRQEGVPIVRLLGWALRALGPRMGTWPGHGEHDLSLPACLWIYRDVVILGQALPDGDVEKRAATVKRVQRALAIPEGLARLVAAEVSRDVAVLGGLRLVRQARHAPDQAVLRLGRRVRRLGGHIGRRSKVLLAVATLLGRTRYDLMKLMGRLDEPPVVVAPVRRLQIRARKAARRAGLARRRAGTWLARRPQMLLVLGFAIGLVALVLAVLAILGVWQPWGPTGPAPPGPGAAAPAPPQPPPGWDDFVRKYPADQPPDPPADGPATPAEP